MGNTCSELSKQPKLEEKKTLVKILTEKILDHVY